MLVINSYTINQFDSYFDKLKISIWQVFWQPYDRLLLVIFNKINLQHLTCSQDFKVTTQLQLEIYYHVKKLTMEEKIIAAIQHILSKSTQRVISQRIFRFINKGAVSSGCELSQDCINGLEIDGLISKKKKGKNGSFFINPIAQDSKKKKDEPDNVEKAHKTPESPKAIKKLESWDFHYMTPTMPTISTPLLYRKDNLDGHKSNVCTEDRSFYEEILF